jgi:primase-polymerase (primpol)-like protein
MRPVAKLNAHLSSVTCPSELADLQAWLMWREEYREGDDKARKVPYYVNGARRSGKQGAPSDRQALTTFAAARAAAARKGFDGVGLALLPDWGVVALDFDKCITNGQPRRPGARTHRRADRAGTEGARR